MPNRRISRVLHSIVFLLALPLYSQSGQTEYSEPFYFEASSLFKSHVILPTNYDSTKTYPLVIGLHGGGGSADDFKSLWQNLEHQDFIYVAPQAPYAWLMGSSLGYDWSLWPTGDLKLIGQAAELSKNYIVDLVRGLKKQYAFDETYLLGFSQGAILTYITGIEHHDLFEGLIIFSGPGLRKPIDSPWTGEMDGPWPTEEMIGAGNHLRVFMVHGSEDQNVAYDLAVFSRDMLTQNGYDVTFRDFVGGHSVNKKFLQIVADWITK